MTVTTTAPPLTGQDATAILELTLRWLDTAPPAGADVGDLVHDLRAAGFGHLLDCC